MWYYTTGSVYNVHSSPAVVDGVVYFASTVDKVYALSAQDVMTDAAQAAVLKDGQDVAPRTRLSDIRRS